MVAPAELARSILACPREIELSIDGVPCALESEIAGGVLDQAGAPMFLCRPGGRMSRASRMNCPVLLTMTSGMRGDELLTLTGTLRWLSAESCDCCNGMRDQVVVDVVEVVLDRDGERIPVSLDRFSDPSLELNAGHLFRSQDHMNRAHGDALREAVARRTGVEVDDVLGAQLTQLSARGAELQWVTMLGALVERLDFPAEARTDDELGAYLRDALRVDVC